MFDERINNVGVAAIEIDTDASDLFDRFRIRFLLLINNNGFLRVRIPRQTFLKLLPVRAAVGGLVHRTWKTPMKPAFSTAPTAPTARKTDRDSRRSTEKTHNLILFSNRPRCPRLVSAMSPFVQVREAGMRGLCCIRVEPLIRPSATFSPLRRGEGGRWDSSGESDGSCVTSCPSATCRSSAQNDRVLRATALQQIAQGKTCSL